LAAELPMDPAPITQERDVFHVEQVSMESVPACPLCGSVRKTTVIVAEDHTVSHQRFELKDCADCGFRFTDPRPSQNDIGQFYESEEYISHSNSRTTLHDRLYQIARKWALKNKHELIRRHKPDGKVLDVGCGTGEFLAYLMGRGYSVHGVEPSEKARRQAIESTGINVTASLEKLPAQEQFQVITMWHVLEHLPDLRNAFKRLYSLMSDGGLLVIAVPDRECWDASHFGSKWAAWDVPRHLSHFRRKDVHRLLKEHGFEIVETRRMLMDAPYIAMLSSRYEGSGALVALVKGMIIGAISNVISLIGGRPTSSSLYIAKKAGV
jgi:2-polyprenyl-3-methyl-5-hydroxy-6-metoxy-1,4-benzoquinol methylase